jgi:hypothetical protein
VASDRIFTAVKLVGRRSGDEVGGARTRKQVEGEGMTGWETVRPRIAPAADAGGDNQVGDGYSVRYHSADVQAAVITVSIYPVRTAEAGEYGLEVQTAYVVCRDRLDPGGTEEWSDTMYEEPEDQAPYRDLESAQAGALKLAEAYAAGSCPIPDWDGRPS